MIQSQVLLLLIAIGLIAFSKDTIPFGVLIIAMLLFMLLKFLFAYQRSCYKNISDNSIFRTYFDTGIYGEFMTVCKIEGIEDEEKILTNVYVPNAFNKNETTEIDVIYINSSGVYVLESKNYSGWIFGTDTNKYWTQSLNRNSKNKFFNPIWQNKGHIEALKAQLQLEEKFFKSIIVFSERCELKKVVVKARNVTVLKRNKLRNEIKRHGKEQMLNTQEKEDIYQTLKKYSNVDESLKKKHIEDIENKIEKNNKEDKKIVHKSINAEEKVNTTMPLHDLREMNTQKSDADKTDFIGKIEDTPIYKELRALRYIKSKEDNVKAYYIYSNSQIEDIVKQMPRTLQELRAIVGFGEQKCSKYGVDILSVVNKY